MESERIFDEEHIHQQQQNEQYKSPEMCWCGGGTSNLGEVKWVQMLKGMFRSLVREEVEDVVKRVILPHLPSLQNSGSPVSSSLLPHQVESSAPRRLYLRFDHSLPETLLTMNKIQYEVASLKVELLDDFGSRVEDGPESSSKIMIVVLDGDFKNEDNDWTKEDFNKNLARPRKDKAPLLKGKCEISLSRGVASISDISFTDNSKSIRNGTFRLGAQVVKTLPGVVIREAVSNAFKVKERRLQYNMKNKMPSPEDDLWRLVNIRNNGPVYQRAVNAKIYTVKDFLQLYHTDAKAMQDILGIRGMKWKEIVENAEACVLNSECYRYYDDTSGVVLHLDCAFNILNIDFKGQTSQRYESLDNSQKELVNRLRCIAYQTRSELETYTPTNQITKPAELIWSSSTPPTSIQYLDATAASQGGQVVHMNSSSPAPVEPFQHYGEELQDDDSDWFRELLSNPALQEWGNLSDIPTENNATSKLMAACYVTKAATMFMISIQGDHNTVRKKRKLH